MTQTTNRRAQPIALPARLNAVAHVRADASASPAAAVAQLNTAWATFQQKIEERTEDVVRREELARIEASIASADSALNDYNARLDAIAANAGTIDSAPAVPHPEYSAAFASWFRTGRDEHAVESALRTTPMAALTVGTPADGGYLAPTEWNREIITELRALSSMRQLASAITVGVDGYYELVQLGTTGAEWVSETGTRNQTGTATFGRLDFASGELSAMPRASQRFLDDAQVNAESWLAREVAHAFAEAEDAAFVDGDGVNKPTGILRYLAGVAPGDAHPLGPILAHSVTSPSVIDADDIMDLIHALPAKYTRGARFVANRLTLAEMRKLRDGDGRYLYMPATSAAEPSSFGGYPMSELERMPNIGASATPILFGDIAAAYRIVDRAGIRVLRDPYSAKPNVLFYTTMRVGGGVRDPRPLRALTMAAS